jgi:hypothetical protein
MMPTPEQRARQDIDQALEAAGSVIQDRAAMNLAAGSGVAVREFRMASGHGFADYLLFVNGKAKWSETPRLNRAIWEKHRSPSQAAVRADFDSSYSRIVHIVETLSPQQPLSPGQCQWTGKHPLTTYLGANTASHYRFAIKAIKRWLKGTAGADTSTTRPDKRLQPPKAGVSMRTRRVTRPRLRG